MLGLQVVPPSLVTVANSTKAVVCYEEQSGEQAISEVMEEAARHYY